MGIDKAAMKKLDFRSAEHRERWRAQSEKLAAVARLAEGVAHAMNNVLATVMGLASVLEAELDPASPQAEDVRGILAASRKGLDQTRSLLGLAQGGHASTERVSLNRLVEVVTSLLDHTFPDHVELKMDLAADLTDIRGDAVQLRHMLTALTTNAVEAIRRRGTVTFATGNVMVQAVDGGAAVPHARIQVADTGVGMDAETLERALDPSFSTKGAPGVAGLGLALVCATVERHGGTILVYSKRGLGTTVTIDLPAFDGDARHSEPPPEAETVSATAGTILLVDDEKLVRSAGKRLLEKLGYDVIVAESGQEALDLYETERARISVVLLDLVMPGVDGRAVLRRLREMNPDVRVVICTGIGSEGTDQELAAMGACGFVRKPYTLRQISADLVKAMRGRAPG